MALISPTVDTRSRIPESVIQELIAQIADKFQPERIILFGSYAYGIPRPESDVDLLIVMETSRATPPPVEQIPLYARNRSINSCPVSTKIPVCLADTSSNRFAPEPGFFSPPL